MRSTHYRAWRNVAGKSGVSAEPAVTATKACMASAAETTMASARCAVRTTAALRAHWDRNYQEARREGQKATHNGYYTPFRLGQNR